EGQAPFALPMVTTSAEAAKIKKPMLASSTLCKYFDVIDAVRRKTGGEGVVKLPDIQSPMGIAALIWNKADLFVAMHEEPEAVKELAEKVQSFLADFFDEWFARYGKDFIAHFPDYYMPYGVTLSDDEIGAVSSKMFKEFFEPGLRFLTERYGALGIHCCAHARHQWENLRGLQNLKLLNLNTGAAHVHDAFDFFKDKCAQWNEWFDADVPFWQAAERLSKGTRCVINVNAETKEEALRLSELLNEKYGKV
ncbi:MAG: hypothetical protein FWE82_05250, partial [Defluviitaleaceae bacterium]|nr:hypothetical protein [Defluviitaleaceae bacterium]